MAHQKNHPYQILPPSPWPFLGAFGAFVMLYGAVLFFHDRGPWIMTVGLLLVLYTMYGWWSDVIREAMAGEHTPVVRIGLRYGVILFITSEVMFFVAWFWSFFKHALYPMGEIVGFSVEPGVWPPAGIETFDPWHLPLINTLILLASGCFATWAHHAIAHDGDNRTMGNALVGAVLLGILFTITQAYEYSHASFGFAGNIYGANFFMATGFHGFHVIVGTIFLAVCMFRAFAGHFTKEAHVGYEAAAWYWHFVDVVWLFLFAVVYIWGG
ncbi:cytochrome c oxidase subunit 3 [Oceanicella actignis]|uniref:Cytochrome c oxidase subunit 3 n=1 Tax=Oceanicella actignis TaxID=1189325 RepID=A0A1M7TJI6_9RHOB|nr:cytochrome c oxidase subunit 3 [Oceanicella actignis]SET66572.1 cytochrome c oxidase subunit 3 [Oceanicella actignis]SHN70880.1 cytochrome c oxidase subunit 3 [Oceanicella actignis]